MKIKSFLKTCLLSLLALIIYTSHCQIYTSVQDELSLEIEAPAPAAAKPFSSSCTDLPNLNRTLQVFVHWTIDSLGVITPPASVLEDEFDRLNQNFAPIGLRFEICFQDTIENHTLSEWETAVDEDVALIYYYTPKVINLYMPVSIINEDDDACGYGFFPGEEDVVVVPSPCLVDGRALTHAFGNFFGLYHTYETMFGFELADGSNCATTGDLICDTEADEQVLFTPNFDCENFIVTNTDADGNYYTPPADNFMSSTHLSCGCRFTNDQFIKMADEYLTNRSYLW